TAYLKETDQVLQGKEELVQKLEAEHGRVQREMDKLYRLYLDDEIPKEGFGKRYRPLETRLKQIEEQIPRVQAERDILKMHYLSSDQIIHNAQDLCANWEEVPAEVRRDLIESITQEIVVGEREVDIALHYAPPIPSQTNGLPAGRHRTEPHDTSNEIQASQRNDGSLATRPQGFMAATSCTRAG
ncbi:MAG: hypothetical protein ACFCUQ_23085, partial [Kiloniellales bacterium]